MERFKRAMGQRFQPVAAVHATRECDAVVRTTTAHETLAHALAAHGGCRFVAAAATAPPAWEEAVSRLEAALCTRAARPEALVAAYAAELEVCTASAAHDFLAAPLTRITAAWVSQPQLADRLHALAEHAPRPVAGTMERPAPIHVVLVARRGSRQDDAASDPAVAVAHCIGAAAVHLLRLGEQRGPHTVAAVADALVAALHEELASRSAVLSEAATRLRRASRSAFRSWFGGPPTASATLRQLQPTAASSEDGGILSNTARLGLPGGLERRSSPFRGATTPGGAPRHRRRGSFGGDLEHTPLFDPDSLESVSRQLADLQMLVGRYEEAVDGYRLLVNDFRGLTGAARVHEAAAIEMLALAMALIDGSKVEVGRALQKAVDVYIASGRRELAVRTTFRVVDFYFDARFPESAGPVLVRAIEHIFSAPNASGALPLLPATPSSFLDGAAGVLHARAALAFMSTGKRRRAALHAFLGAGRLSKLNLHGAAAAVVRLAHPPALVWPSVQDEYELVLGQAEMVGGSALHAAHHFTRILANSTDDSDVELQSSVVRQLSAAVGKGAVDGMLKSWDSGTSFPDLIVDRVRVDTFDSRDEESQDWHRAEDAILADFEYFEQVRSAVTSNVNVPVREKPVDVVIAELRRLRDLSDEQNPGGSLENKISRMGEKERITRKRRRVRSLLERCAVVGEHISVTVTLRNPLHFPVFVNDVSPVVTLDGKCYSAKRADIRSGKGFLRENNGNGGGELFPIQFLPEDEIVLGPKSVQDVILKILVHEQGVLRFIGAQWLFTVGMGDSRSRASSQVPGFAKFERRGRRLNETRKQRASEVPRYGRETSLEVEVTSQAPRIKVCIEGLEEGEVAGTNCIELRAGELRKATLILKNEGAIEARGIAFRIDTPNSLYLDTKELAQYNRQGQFMSSDLGMMYVLDACGNFARSGAPVVAGFLPVCIQPGESISHTVWLRASIVASSPRAAFAQSHNSRSISKVPTKEQQESSDCPFAITVAYGATRARVSRYEGRVLVRSSVLVSRRFMSRANPLILPDSGEHGGEGITLGVEVEHAARTPGDIPTFQIVSLSVTSTKQWGLSPLPRTTEPVSKDPSAVTNKRTTLRANETATLFSVLHSTESESIPSSNEWHSSLLEFGLETEAISDSPTSVLSTEKVHALTPVGFNDAAQHFVLTNQMHTSFGAPKPTPEAGEDLACVAVGWRDTRGARGELYLQPIDLQRWMSSSRPESAMHTRSSSFVSLNGVDANERLAEESREILNRIAAEAPPLRVVVRHAKRMVHNFSRPTPHGNVAVPAIVHVDVYIKNVSQRLIDVIFAAAPHGGIADGDRGRYWAGDVAMSLRALPPESERFLQLSAVLERPGSYNMAQFTIKYQISLLKQLQKKISFAVQPSIIVVDSAETLLEAEKRAGALPKTTVFELRNDDEHSRERRSARRGNETNLKKALQKPGSPREQNGNRSPVRKVPWRIAHLPAESGTVGSMIRGENAIWKAPETTGGESLL